jgi:hypothetical protein
MLMSWFIVMHFRQDRQQLADLLGDNQLLVIDEVMSRILINLKILVDSPDASILATFSFFELANQISEP